MSTKPPIVCISFTSWYGYYTKSTVQLMSLLAQDRKVLFVEYPYTYKDLLSSMVSKKQVPSKRMLGIQPHLKKVTSTFDTEVYNLVVHPVLPVDFIPNDKIFEYFFKKNTNIYQRIVRQTMKDLGIEKPIVVTAYNPFYGLAMIGKLDELLNVYYCYDGIDILRHGHRIFEYDKQFSQGVDAIITSSDFIKSEKQLFNPNCYTVKNGVDFNLFSKNAKQGVRTNNKRPVIGYLGSMDHRFDIDTVEYAIQQLPGYEFIFVGDLRNEKVKQRLDPYHNTSFMPPVEAYEVPKILADCDLGIIPYLVNDINRSIYPLKINEYMAVGVPVVMTAFAKLPEFDGIVDCVDNQESFVHAIKQTIENDTDDKVKKRIAYAKKNSWQNKAIEFDRMLEILADQKKSKH